MVGGGEWIWWLGVDVDVEVSFCCEFFFSFFVSVGFGMGGGWLVMWCWQCYEKERDKGERGKIKKLLINDKEILFKLNGKKNRSFDIGYIVK